MKLQPKAGVIKMKTTQRNILHIFSPRWTKHFIFGHFIAFAAITVISLKIYKILQKLLKPFQIKLRLRIWTFHHNCRYNSHLIEDLSDMTEALNSNHFRSKWDFIFGHFIAIVAITFISLKIYKIWQKP